MRRKFVARGARRVMSAGEGRGRCEAQRTARNERGKGEGRGRRAAEACGVLRV